MKKITACLLALWLLPAWTAAAAVLEGTVQKIDREQNMILLNTESVQKQF